MLKTIYNFLVWLCSGETPEQTVAKKFKKEFVSKMQCETLALLYIKLDKIPSEINTLQYEFGILVEQLKTNPKSYEKYFNKTLNKTLSLVEQCNKKRYKLNLLPHRDAEVILEILCKNIKFLRNMVTAVEKDITHFKNKTIINNETTNTE